MIDFAFSTGEEIARELGGRLKAQRLSQDMSQAELAARAGISERTVKNIENKGQASLVSLLQVLMALGLSDELQPLFNLQVKSIAQMEKVANSTRKRAPRKFAK